MYVLNVIFLFSLLFSWLTKKLKKTFKLKVTVDKLRLTYVKGLLIEREGLFKVVSVILELRLAYLKSLLNEREHSLMLQLKL